MPSRSGTAAQSRASKQQSRGGQTRGTTTQGSERSEGYTADSQGTGTRSRRTATAGQQKSLFDASNRSRGGEEGDGGDGVKENDIWNKFVSDDQDVVRAPTAESGVSGLSGDSQLTGSQVTGSQGSQRPSQIDEEDEEEEEESSDDDRTIYSDYYLPPEYMREEGTPGPRAEIVDSHEACSCFPNRSNKFVGSMLYDKITCKHTGLTGHTQPGVFKFNPYWNENMEEPRRLRKRDMRIAKSKYVFGYPKPRFELVSESEDEYDDEDDDEDDDSERREGTTTSGKKVDTPKTAKTNKTRVDDDDDDEEDDDDDDDYDDYDSDEYDDDYDEEDEDYIPYRLPEIGYPQTPSLPPSSQSFRSQYSDFTESVTELPSLPPTRQLTAQTKRTGVTQRTQRTHFTLPSQRQETKRSTKTAKTGKSDKSGKKSAKKAESIDSGYDDDASRRTVASRQSLPAGPVIGTSRTFQGKFYDPVTKQIMLYDIGTRPGQRIPAGNMEPLYKPVTAENIPSKTADKNGAGSKPGTKGSKRSTTSQQSHHSIPKAAVLGAVFISNLLSKNKANKEATEAGYSDDEEET